jgi:hypothetical protein
MGYGGWGRKGKGEGGKGGFGIFVDGSKKAERGNLRGDSLRFSLMDRRRLIKEDRIKEDRRNCCSGKS